jgi:hypothetical protein
MSLSQLQRPSHDQGQAAGNEPDALPVPPPPPLEPPPPQPVDLAPVERFVDAVWDADFPASLSAWFRIDPASRAELRENPDVLDMIAGTWDALDAVGILGAMRADAFGTLTGRAPERMIELVRREDPALLGLIRGSAAWRSWFAARLGSDFGEVEVAVGGLFDVAEAA